MEKRKMRNVTVCDMCEVVITEPGLVNTCAICGNTLCNADAVEIYLRGHRAVSCYTHLAKKVLKSLGV